MSRTERFRPTGAAVIGAMIAALALAGCSAGQVTQTSSQVPAVGGANSGVGQIAVRDVQIEFADQVEGGNVYARGGNAPLRMTIVNAGAGPDRLVSVTSPVASSVQISGVTTIPGGQALDVEGEPVVAAEPVEETGEETGEESGGSDSATTTAPVPTASETPAEGAQIVLTGLREDIRAGLTYPLVLTFERAGQIRVDVPVGNPSTPRADEHEGGHGAAHG